MIYPPPLGPLIKMHMGHNISTSSLRFDKGFETVTEETSRFRHFYFDRAVHIRTYGLQ